MSSFRIIFLTSILFSFISAYAETITVSKGDSKEQITTNQSSDNTVNIYGTVGRGGISIGSNSAQNSSNNTINIFNGSKIQGNITASNGTGNLNNNKITIEGGAVIANKVNGKEQMIYGVLGKVNDSEASTQANNNIIKIGTANGQKVNINDFYGIKFDYTNDGKVCKNVGASNNTIIINNAEALDIDGFDTISNSRNNIITIENVTVKTSRSDRKRGYVVGFTNQKNVLFSSKNDAVTFINADVQRSIYGIEANDGSIQVENFNLHLKNSKADEVIGILAVGNERNPLNIDSYIKDSYIDIISTKNGGINTVEGIRNYINGSIISGNYVVLGYDPETKETGNINVSYGGVTGINSGGIPAGWDTITGTAVVENNTLLVGGAKDNVNIDGEVIGVNLRHQNSIAKGNNTFIGYNFIKGDDTPLYANITWGVKGAQASGDNHTLESNHLYIGGLDSQGNVTTKIGGSIFGAILDGSGQAINNIVNIVDGAEITNSEYALGVYGAQGNKGNTLLGNAVIIDATKNNSKINIKGSIYGAEVTGSMDGTLQDNIVKIYGNLTLDGSIYGAKSVSGTLNKNVVAFGKDNKTSSITINSKTGTDHNVYAAYNSGNGTLSDNFIIFSGDVNLTAENSNLYGAYGSGINDMINNNVIVGSEKFNKQNDVYVNSIYGAYNRGDGNLLGNNVIIYDTINTKGNIYGAFLEGNGNLNGNTVQIFDDFKSTNTTTNVYGAYGTGKNNLEANSVIIGDPKRSNPANTISLASLYGAYSTGSNNQLLANNIGVFGNANISGDIAAAYSKGSNTVSNNIVNIAGNVEVKGNIYGGYSEGGLLSNNSISINGTLDKTTVDVTGNIYGAYSAANSTLTNNIVNIIGNTSVNTNVYGAYNLAQSGELSHNKVIIGNKPVKEDNEAAELAEQHSVNVTELYGGYNKGNGKLESNSVEIYTKTNVTGNIYGAYAEGGENSLSNNNIVINSDESMTGILSISGNIYGAYNAGKGDVLDNTIIFRGNNNLQNSIINGGYAANGKNQGHTLIVENGYLHVKDIANFDKIDIRNNLWSSNVIKLANTNKSDLKNTALVYNRNLYSTKEDILNTNGNMHLIVNNNNVNISPDKISDTSEGVVKVGVGEIYHYNVENDKNGVRLVIAGMDAENPELPKAEIDPQLSSLLGGRDTLALMVKSGADLVANLNSTVINPAEENNQKHYISTFAVSGGGYVQDKGPKNTLDLYRGTLVTGIGGGFTQKNATVFMAAFFDGGWGSYSNINHYDKQNTVHSQGKTEYYGGGFILRSDFNVKNDHVVYFDTSFRGGVASYDYESNDNLVNVDDTLKGISYKSETPYYGTHFGLGYQYKLQNKYLFDFFGKYMFSYYEDDKVNIYGADINFDEYFSHRLLLSSRFSFKAPLGFTPYFGVGYEHQFDGKIGGNYNGMAIPENEALTGANATFEAGFTYAKKFSKVLLKIDLKGKGTAGSINSGLGNLTLRLDF